MPKTPPNIILTGYRATGKSSVGKLLASRLSFDFIDMDKVIEAKEGQTINSMVADKGWPYFRQKEQQLLEVLITKSDQIIATGGGAILRQDLWPKIMNAGLVVWLTANTETICGRLAGDNKTSSQRPSLTGCGTEQEVATVLAEREPLYKAGSHIAVDTGTTNMEEISEIIHKEFCNCSDR